ncbi:MAG TPA: hypothetical protein VMR34_05525 [Candidatus Saccharimonadales bacterium]|nr:hypothetical protein [Candidatus Saccharimonadales bacterium]
MSNKTVLVTMPDYEPTTRYLAAWAKSLIQYAERRSVNVLKLDKKRANRKEFESIVTKMSPDLIFMNGHGAEHCVTGQDEEVLLDMDNSKILKGTIAYAVSCKSAAQLGPETIKKGAKSFIGYTQDFIFFSEGGTTSKPRTDKTAALFLDPSNQVVVSLLKGKSASESVKKGKQEFTRNILKASSSEAQLGYGAYLRFLWWDRQYLTHLGKDVCI